jgi:hypothetical protein
MKFIEVHIIPYTAIFAVTKFGQWIVEVIKIFVNKNPVKSTIA